MLRWAVIFLVIAIISGVLGFGYISGVSVQIAQILFIIFIVLFIIAVVANSLRGKSPPL